MEDRRLSPRLGPNALARVDENHSEIRVRRPRRNVADVLRIPGTSATIKLRLPVSK